MDQIKTLSALSDAEAPAAIQKDEFEADDDEAKESVSKANEPIWAVEALYSIIKNSRVFKHKNAG